jgi:hypothetical protein
MELDVQAQEKDSNYINRLLNRQVKDYSDPFCTTPGGRLGFSKYCTLKPVTPVGSEEFYIFDNPLHTNIQRMSGGDCGLVQCNSLQTYNQQTIYRWTQTWP